MENNTAYIKSNQITEVKYNRFTKGYADELERDDISIATRQKIGQNLLNYLCDKYKIVRVKLNVTERPRLQRGNAQIYGRYGLNTKSIVIYNTTPKTHKEVSGKSFFDTLIHEFCHHLDYNFYKLDNSLHTKGFYMRINDLKNKLR